MRVVISAGGTGGHIYPALAIVNKIKELEPDSEFLYIGTHNRMEKDIVPNRGIPFEAVEMYGFNRKHLLKNFKTLGCILKATKRCKKLISDFKPDVVVGVGGYITYPVIKAAHKLGIKTFIHEQNSIAGKANLGLVKYASLIGVSFKSSMNDFPKDKVVFTGNPVGEDALKVKACDKEEFDLSNKKELVLIVMGSLGSGSMNELILKEIDKFKDKEYEVAFVTGKDGYEDAKKYDVPSNVKLFPYIENMTRLMRKTDVLVSRAGASTISELVALKVPSILIPSPYVANNHQYKNAIDLKNGNACELLEEKDFNVDNLIKLIDGILDNKEKRNQMIKNLEKFDNGKSATAIYNYLRKLVDGK